MVMCGERCRSSLAQECCSVTEFGKATTMEKFEVFGKVVKLFKLLLMITQVSTLACTKSVTESCSDPMKSLVLTRKTRIISGFGHLSLLLANLTSKSSIPVTMRVQFESNKKRRPSLLCYTRMISRYLSHTCAALQRP